MPPSELAEQELIQRARTGSDEAFSQLVLQNAPRLYRAVQRMVNDESEADNVIQETFLRTWQSLSRLDISRPLFPYLVTVALNLCRDMWKKNRTIEVEDLDSIDSVVASGGLYPESQVERDEILAALATAVAELPAHDRVVIALRYDGGLDYQQMAESLSLPLNTIRTRVRRAKEKLKYALKEKGYG